MPDVHNGSTHFHEQRQMPCNVRPEDAELFKKVMTARFPRWSHTRLSNAQVFGRSPIRSEDGSFVVDSFVSQKHFDRWKRERGHWRAAAESLLYARKRFDDPAVWITDNWSCGYFHWFGDALPRLEIVLQSVPAAELTLLLPSKFRRHAYFIESLRAFGLRDVRILKRFESLRCRELYLPTHVAPTGNYDSTLMRSLRDKFRAHSHKLETGPVYPNLYISRRSAGRRRIANEHELLPVFADHGFHVLVAEETSWQRQLQLAAAAELLVSNHGAGLTNMLMMKTGSRVMEIREQNDAKNNCYLNMASALSLPYHYLLGHRSDPNKSVHLSDLIVDPKRLDEALAEMLHSNHHRNAA